LAAHLVALMASLSAHHDGAAPGLAGQFLHAQSVLDEPSRDIRRDPFPSLAA
jgi:hypothetical protein